MSPIKYLLDEHVDPALKPRLLNRQPEMEVWRRESWRAADELELIWEASDLAEYRDLIRHLPLR